MRIAAALGITLLVLGTAPSVAADAKTRPNVLIVTVDTLRADRLSGYGYEKQTSPNIDRLLAQGAVFTQARTVEPLTGPAMCAVFTSRYPHENGATRNGLRMREGLSSLPTLLQAHGYRTGAIVSNWTLKNKLSGLGEHFEQYREIMKRRRWFGLFNPEAVAADVTASAIEWLEEHKRDHADRPFLLWVHYSEPHAPYRFHREYRARLGISQRKPDASERYDTEIAKVDDSIGELLAALREAGLADTSLTVFSSDHGESLGEHDYWGHGRHLYEPTLHVPMSITWPDRLEPRTIDAVTTNLDLAPTIVGLLGLEVPPEFRGYDWTDVLQGAEAPTDRITRHQAHRGAVISRHDSELARRAGLLEVGVVRGSFKEVVRFGENGHWRFDLDRDPREILNLAQSEPTLTLREWMEIVDTGLDRTDEAAPPPLDDETIEQLRALGYAD
jgi:arylsulfatase A-like enzyme